MVCAGDGNRSAPSPGARSAPFVPLFTSKAESASQQVLSNMYARRCAAGQVRRRCHARSIPAWRHGAVTPQRLVSCSTVIERPIAGNGAEQSGAPVDTPQKNALARLTADWLLGNLRAPRPAPVDRNLTCVIPDCSGMSFVLLPSIETCDGVCFRHYQTILKASGAHKPGGVGKFSRYERTAPGRV